MHTTETDDDNGEEDYIEGTALKIVVHRLCLFLVSFVAVFVVVGGGLFSKFVHFSFSVLDLIDCCFTLFYL